MASMDPFLSVLMLLLAPIVAGAIRRCPNCGNVTVPYPLSTGPDCGDQSYKIRCNGAALWFNSLNGSSHLITSISPQMQKLVIRPSGWADRTCLSLDYWTQGIMLDPNLPFNVTGSNTLILMNCSSEMLQLTVDCSSTSICHKYIKENAMAAAYCGGFPLCCSLKTGGSQNAYRIRIRDNRCRAWQSFVNLDPILAVSKWPEPGLEISWELPREPTCKSQIDCLGLPESVCLKDPLSNQNRCFCKSRFRWDPIRGMCYNRKCPQGRKCKRRTLLLTGGLTCSVVAALFTASIALIIRRHREGIKREAQLSLSKMREDILNANSLGKPAKIFTGKNMIKATNNFSKENLLGAGGFGEVFKGVLDDGTVTAIKRAKVGNTRGIDQILNEVRILCQVNHRSLVRLLGCCVDLELPLLVYEYVPNGNLFDHLHLAQRQKLPPLSWLRRLVIAHQTAEGLAYLHTSAIPPIYHRDVKSSNILLDSKIDAKVSDFGLSRLAVTDQTHITTCAQGTLGYLDPEYYLNFQLTDKSDVYSFGVVLLELLTSKKAIDFNREDDEVNLAVHIRRIMKEESLMEAIDPAIKEGATKLEVETMHALAHLASACVDERRQNRPSMKEVAEELQYIISILEGQSSQS
ncbi:hypothetical protein CDL15_Pgr007827 [Punica granatum]|uniref:Protein kinase domain-containing protein n=1 Tax=Punica granatum TaxID=22663 RepID=A0A218XAQ9_PUNGR|nr:hypothetical protein CDL15_Pgr007827 [Punica granatum]PKI43442.1 hypothetical protein CRG98_036199 [Punica granatum]